MEGSDETIWLYPIFKESSTVKSEQFSRTVETVVATELFCSIFLEHATGLAHLYTEIVVHGR